MSLDEQIGFLGEVIERTKKQLDQLKLERLRQLYNIGVGEKFVSKGYGWNFAKDKECEIIAIFPEKEIIEVKVIGRADRFRLGSLDIKRQFG